MTDNRKLAVPHRENPDPPATSPHRRAVMRGALWTSPVVIASFAAPAYAISECVPLTDAELSTATPTFTEGLPGWTRAASPEDGFTTSGDVPIAYRDSYGPDGELPNQAVLSENPRLTGEVTATLTADPFCLGPGTYAFTYSGRSFGANIRTIWLDAAVLDETETPLAWADRWVVAGGGVHRNLNGQEVQLVISEPTRLRFRFTWTFPADASLISNDIGVQAPSVARIA